MKKVIAILMIAIFSLSCFSFAFADEAVEDAELDLVAVVEDAETEVFETDVEYQDLEDADVEIFAEAPAIPMKAVEDRWTYDNATGKATLYYYLANKNTNEKIEGSDNHVSGDATVTVKPTYRKSGAATVTVTIPETKETKSNTNLYIEKIPAPAVTYPAEISSIVTATSCLTAGTEVTTTYEVDSQQVADDANIRGIVPKDENIVSASDPVSTPLMDEEEWQESKYGYHKFVETKTNVKKDFENCYEAADGTIVVIDKTKAAGYWLGSEAKCSVCGQMEPYYRGRWVELNTIIDTEQTYAWTDANSNILGYYQLDRQGNLEVNEAGDPVLYPIDYCLAKDLPQDNTLIVLVDCKKAGTYYLGYESTSGNYVMKQKITVPAHDTEWQYISVDAKKLPYVSIVPQNGLSFKKQTITNLSCKEEVKYDLITICLNPNDKGADGNYRVIKKETKTLEKSTNHSINIDLYNELSYPFRTLDVWELNDELHSESDPAPFGEKGQKEKYIKITDVKHSHDMESFGTAKVTFLCMVCGAEVETIDVKVQPHEGWESDAVYVTIKEPTCTETGTADRDFICGLCGGVLRSEKNIEVATLPHTNQVEEWDSYTGTYVKRDLINSKAQNAAIALDGEVIIGGTFSEKTPYLYGSRNNEIYYEQEDYNSPITIGNQAGYRAIISVNSFCETCGGNPVVVGLPVVEITQFTPNDAKTGTAGSVTIHATYRLRDNRYNITKILEATKTFEYYDSFVSYLDRKQVTQPDPEVETTVTIFPATLTMNVGDKELLEITHTPVTAEFATQTSNAMVATVDSEGNVTAVAPGTATITATIGEVSATCKVTVLFKDNTDSKAYYYDAVNWAAETGVTQGTGEYFNVNETTTRGQVVTFLYRQAGSPAVSGEMPFTDVPDWCHDAVLWAYQNGITTGYKDGKGNLTGKFGASDYVTREQVITFQYRAAKADASAPAAGYTDVKSGSYYENAVNWGTANGIVQMNGASAFGVGNRCTRGMIVTWIYRATK